MENFSLNTFVRVCYYILSVNPWWGGNEKCFQNTLDYYLQLCPFMLIIVSFLGSSAGKESACNAEDSVQFLGREVPPEEGRQHNPVLLPGESPWTEVPGGLQSMGLQRVEQDRAIKHSTACLSLAWNAYNQLDPE